MPTSNSASQTEQTFEKKALHHKSSNMFSWTHVIIGSLIYYLLHIGTTHFYMRYCIKSGWSPIAIVAPHCNATFSIMTYTRENYFILLGAFFVKFTQELANLIETRIRSVSQKTSEYFAKY